jgi:hypothetical protein
MGRSHFKRIVFFFLLVAPTLLLVHSAFAAGTNQSITIDPVNAMVNGTANTNIGNIGATLGDVTSTGTGIQTPNRMQSNFHLNPANAMLASCYNFHWLQVVTQLAAGAGNPTYKNKALVIPIIDTPNGGYDGQVGEDALPWYLTAAEEATFNTTNADMSMDYLVRDTPSVNGAAFATWLIANPIATPNTICVITGFSWGSGNLQAANPLTVIGAPGAADVATINTALTNGNFPGYTVMTNCNLVCVPEPTTGILALASMTGLMLRRRRAA